MDGIPRQENCLNYNISIISKLFQVISGGTLKCVIYISLTAIVYNFTDNKYGKNTIYAIITATEEHVFR